MSDRIWTLMSWIVNDGATWAEVKHKAAMRRSLRRIWRWLAHGESNR